MTNRSGHFNLNFWEKASFTDYDYIIIGSGIVGLSTAIELKTKFPATKILILERGFFPSGASTRNAGFACMGSVTELTDDLTVMEEEEVIALYEMRKKGLEKLRKRLGDWNIGYAEKGSYELINDDSFPVLEQIEYLNKLLLPVTKKPAFALADSKINEFGFATDYTKSLVENLCEGELNTGKMMRALIDYALRMGIEIKTGSEVKNFSEENDSVSISIKSPFLDETIILNAKILVICTNAFTKDLLPNEELQPGRGQVLVTKPVSNLKFKGIFHFEKGYYYFREVDGRVLFGGGRNLDFTGETTTDFGLNKVIQSDLENKLKEVIIPGIPFEVEYRWSGIMAFGPTKYPVVKEISDRIFGAFRLGGMGVALGSEVASKVVDLIEVKYKDDF